MKTVRIFASATLFAAAIAASGAAFAQSKPDIRIATGRQGGAYYNMAALVADSLYRSGKVNSATAESSSGGPENLRLLDKSLGNYFYFMAPFGVLGGLLMLTIRGKVSGRTSHA